MTIPLPDNVKNAISQLNRAGYEAFAVGGCVRDALLGKTPKDFDLTTDALPEEVMQVFSDRHTIGTGLAHGTVTVMMDGMPLEITTYRIDAEYTDHRHPDQVIFTRSLKEDAARRDFTVNALAYHDQLGIIDHFGGLEDLSKKQIRAVGNAEKRFEEDALRILRALRFSSVLGFAIVPETLAAARTKKHLLQNVSAERIAVELNKLLCGKDARRVLTEYYDILGEVLPELLPMVGFLQHNPHHCYDVFTHTAVAVENTPPEPILRLAALLHDMGKPHCFHMDEQSIGHFYGHAAHSKELAENILARLKYDNFTRRQVLELVEHHDLPVEPTEKSVKRALKKFTPELFFPLLQLQRADHLAQHPDFHHRLQQDDAVRRIAEEIIAGDQCFSLKDLAISGKDLLALGMPPGKELGTLLQTLLDRVIDGDLPNEKDALLRYVKEQSSSGDHSMERNLT